MFPFLFELHAGGIDVSLPAFPVLIIGGMAAGVFVYALLSPDVRKKPVAFLFFLGTVFLSALVCSKLGQILVELAAPANAGKPWQEIAGGAGSTVTAGLAGGVVAILVYAKVDPHRIVTWQVLDSFAVAFPFGHMIGRIGCLLNGCCYGAVCDLNNPVGIWYPQNWLERIAHPGIVPGPRWPSPLIEAIGLAVIGLILLAVFKRTKSRGQIVPLYMMLYGGLRFLVEMTRGDDVRGIFGALSTGQWFAIVFFIAGLLCMVRYIAAFRKGLATAPFLTLAGKEVSTRDAFSSNAKSSVS